MDRELIAADLPLSRKSRLPGEGFFVLEDDRERERDREAERKLTDADRVVVADPDADGLACVALLRSVHPHLALLPAGPHDLDDALERVETFGGQDIHLFICDLSPDRIDRIREPLAALIADGATVTWFDHHEWSDAVASSVREWGVDLTIGDSDRECTADVVVRATDDSFPDHLEELAVVTRDHDLWRREDPRSDDLADYAYWADPEEYVDTVQQCGPDLPQEVDTYLAARRVEKDALIELAVDRSRFVEVGPWTVGITYGRCSQNEVAEAMRTEGADASVIVKPSGSASIRGTDAFERCHEVAAQVDGGGHPKAAGCKPPIYTDMMDYAQHWVTEGAVAQRRILTAFETVAAQRDSSSSERAIASSEESGDSSAG